MSRASQYLKTKNTDWINAGFRVGLLAQPNSDIGVTSETHTYQISH